MEKDGKSKVAGVMRNPVTVYGSSERAIYSFDVFDTLITRPFMRPTDIFWLVGRTLSDKHGLAIDPGRYRKARIAAEHRARTASRPLDDCRWDDIYHHFQELSRWGLTRAMAMQAEWDAEQRCLRPIAENVARVHGLIESGEEVIFLSDMYLPTDYVWGLIRQHVVDCPRDRIFVSGDLGLSKHTGRLYSHVIEHYGIAPAHLRHLGDNPYSDVEVPSRLGINAELYRGIQPTHHERLPRLRRWTPMIVSAMHGTARAARLRTIYSETSAPVASIAASVVAPVLTAYVAWILQDAKRRGIERLYFVSRDGQILHLIASGLRRDGDPECRYLYGSRQAWFLPSVSDLDEESLGWAWMKGMSRTGRDILRRLEIDDEHVLSILANKGFDNANLDRQLDDAELDCIKALINKEPIASILLTKAANRRTLLLEYLLQEGCLDGARWALVDIGWGLNCQSALRRVFEAASLNSEISGYYFGVSHDHAILNQVGHVFAYIAHHRARLRGAYKGDWLFKRSTVAIIENFFAISDQRPVRGYCKVGAHISPVFQGDSHADDNKLLAKTVHKIVNNYIDELACARAINPESDIYRRHSLTLTKRFCLYPKAIDVLSIAGLPITDDIAHGKEHWTRLAVPLDMRVVHEIMLDYIPARSKTRCGRLEFSWTAGSAAISSCPVRGFFIMGSTMSRLLESLSSLRFSSFKWLKTDQ